MRGPCKLNWGRGDGRDLDTKSVKLWIANMGLDDNYRWSTINTYIAALRKYESNHGTASSPLHASDVSTLLEGVHRDKGERESKIPIPEKKSLTLDMLIEIEQTVLTQGAQRTYEDKLFLAAAAMGVSGLIRSGDYIDCGGAQHKASLVRMGDLSFFSSEQKDSRMSLEAAVQSQNSVNHAVLRLRRSKTDQRSVGADVFLMGFPVRALLEYIECFKTTRSVEETLFVDKRGSNFTRSSLVTMLRLHLVATGMPEVDAKQFSGHCFRRGGAVHLDDEGDDVVKTAGRWTSSSHKVYHPNRKAKMNVATLAGRPSGRGGLGGEGAVNTAPKPLLGNNKIRSRNTTV
jgi:hypothetical protein